MQRKSKCRKLNNKIIINPWFLIDKNAVFFIFKSQKQSLLQ